MRSVSQKKVFLSALLYKVALGWLLGWIFFFYYQQGDTLHYFADACQLAQLAYRQPIGYLKVLAGQLPPPGSLVFQEQPRAFFFTKVVSIVNIVTYNNYWITSAYFSLLSFWGSWKLAKYLSSCFPEYRYAATIAFLFYPSVVFWGSGVLKESIAIGAITLIVYVVLRLQAGEYREKGAVLGLLSFVVAAVVLWKIKYYYAAVLLPTVFSGAIAYIISGKKQRRFMLPAFVISWLMLVGMVSLLHPALALDRLAHMLLFNHDAIVRMSDPSNIIHFKGLNEHPDSFLKNIPLAVVSGLFRPLAGEGTTFLQWAAGLENTGLLLLGIGALINGWQVRISSTHRLWIAAAMTYIVVLGTLLAFASPNFGSLVRYKVAFLPFLVFLCLIGNQGIVRWLGNKGALVKDSGKSTK